MGLPERLTGVDRELDGFEKSDATLASARESAIALMRELRSTTAPSQRGAIDAIGAIDAAIEAVAEGVSTRTFDARAIRRAEDAAAREPVRTQAPPGAREASWDERAPLRDEGEPAEGSGLVELPENVIRSQPLPPVLSLDPGGAAAGKRPIPGTAAMPPPRAFPGGAGRRGESESFEDSTDVRDPNSLEHALSLELDDEGEALPAASSVSTQSDQGSLAHLFDDAPAIDDARGSGEAGGGLADLFEPGSAPPAAGADASGTDDLADLELPESDARARAAADTRDDDEPDHTSVLTADEVRAIRRSSSPPYEGANEGAREHATFDDGDAPSSLDDELDALVGDLPSEASPLEPAGMPTSGEFELMIDEDVLVIEDGDMASDDDAPAPPATPSSSAAQTPSTAPPAGSPSQPPPKGGGFFSRILNRKG